MEKSISYINLSWAVVGIIDKDARTSLSSMTRAHEPVRVTVERYVLGYMGFWNIAFIRKETLNECHDGRIIQKAKESIERYVASHPPAATLPRFYIVFLNQPQIGCDADSLSDVFCM